MGSSNCPNFNRLGDLEDSIGSWNCPSFDRWGEHEDSIGSSNCPSFDRLGDHKRKPINRKLQIGLPASKSTRNVGEEGARRLGIGDECSGKRKMTRLLHRKERRRMVPWVLPSWNSIPIFFEGHSAAPPQSPMH